MEKMGYFDSEKKDLAMHTKYDEVRAGLVLRKVSVKSIRDFFPKSRAVGRYNYI